MRKDFKKREMCSKENSTHAHTHSHVCTQTHAHTHAGLCAQVKTGYTVVGSDLMQMFSFLLFLMEV